MIAQYRYDENDDNWHVFHSENSNIPNYDVKCIVVDNDHNVWAATYGGGIAVKLLDSLKADFTIDDETTGFVPHSVTFTDKSEPADKIQTWTWYINGTEVKNEGSSGHKWDKIFQKSGTYKVKLKVCNDIVCDEITKIITVKDKDSIKADFSWNKSCGCTDSTGKLRVQFFDESVGDPVINYWKWDFGNGIVFDSASNSVISDLQGGSHTVTLIVGNGELIDTIQKEIIINPIYVNFIADPTYGKEPLTVEFTDQTEAVNTVSWLWVFGDGKTSDQQNPIYKYESPGKYDVTLCVVADCDNALDTCCRTMKNFIEVDTVPKDIVLIKPDDGDVFDANDNSKIRWTHINVDRINVEFRTSPSDSWDILLIRVNADINKQNNISTIYNWIVPDICCDSCQMRIFDYEDTTIADTSTFKIQCHEKTLKISRPSNGDTLALNNIYSILWNYDNIDCINLIISYDNGITWDYLLTNYDPGLYPFTWSPLYPTTNCIIKIIDCNDNNISDSVKVIIIKEDKPEIDYCDFKVIYDSDSTRITAFQLSAGIFNTDSNSITGRKNIIPSIVDTPHQLGININGNFICPPDYIKCWESEIGVDSMQKPLHVGLLVDVSGSMSWKISENDPTKRIDASKRSLKSFVNTLRDYDTTFLMSFSDEVKLLEDWTSSKQTMENSIDKLTAFGSTYLWGAVDSAITKLNKSSRPKAIVLLSDGGNTDPPFWHESNILEKVRNSFDLPIYIIALGLTDDSIDVVGRSRLEQIAKVSGGKIWDVYNADSLDMIYEKIGKEITKTECCEIYINGIDVKTCGWIKLFYSPDTSTVVVKLLYYCNDRISDKPISVIEKYINDHPNMQVYPNPLSELAEMKYAITQPGEVRVLITNLSGNNVLEENIGFHEKGEYSYMIDGTHFQSGTYIATVIQGNTALSRKIIVLH